MLTLNRLILYFPVSALVTLFGNILQNPLDPRAKSDTRLMNMVVVFLSTLGEEAQTGGVHRMLGVCSEFEKIAKKVIDKAERDHAMRRKRKNHDGSAEKTSNKPLGPVPKPMKSQATNPSMAQQTQHTYQTPRPLTSSSSTPQASHQLNSHLSPSMKSDHMTPERAYSPMTATMSHENSPAHPPAGWGTDDFSANSAQQQQQQQQQHQQQQHSNNNPDTTMDFANAFADTSFADLTGFGSIAAMNAAMTTTAMPLGGNGFPGLMDMQSPPISGANGLFQQPMLPADLFSLPMTLDWDWAEMSGGAYPSVENGNFGEGY